MANNLAPVVLFVYNRPYHTQQTTEFLQRNDLAKQSKLFIFSDGPKDEEDRKRVEEVRAYLRTINGFKNITITERENNLGLANSIITGVTEVIDKFGKVIVMEDDLISSPNFLSFMNGALDFYKDDKRIFSVTGLNYPIEMPKTYNHDVYLAYRESSWGWGTWKDRWDKADWEVEDFSEFLKDKRAQKLFNRGGDDLTNMLIAQMKGEIDSWAIRWCYAHFKNNAFCLYPVVSKIQNIGTDGSGTHCGVSNKYNVELDQDLKKIEFPESLEVDKRVIHEFNRMFRSPMRISIIEKLKRIIKENISVRK